jgi:hypothetical protein
MALSACQAAIALPAARHPPTALQAAIVMARPSSCAWAVCSAQETAAMARSVLLAASAPQAAQSPEHAISVVYAPLAVVPPRSALSPHLFQKRAPNATSALRPAQLVQEAHYSCCQISGCPLKLLVISPAKRRSTHAMAAVTPPTLSPRQQHVCQAMRAQLVASAGQATCRCRVSAQSAVRTVRAGLYQP